MPPRLCATLGFALLTALSVGCGRQRPLGETGGVPVAFDVELASGYIEGMSHPVPRMGPMFIDPDPWEGRSRYRYYGRSQPYYHRQMFADPFWCEPGFTDLIIVGGDAPMEAGLFRTVISGGANHFEVLIRPGRTVTLTVLARGDREGWEAIGHFTAADRPGQRVDVTLTGGGPKMAILPPSPIADAAAAPTTAPAAVADSPPTSGPMPAAAPEIRP